jgi:hypothetical protein
MVISDDDWCVRIAQSEYLALRKSKQIELAKQFFDEDIEPLLDELYYLREPFREQFIEASALPGEQLPITVVRQHSAIAPVVTCRQLGSIVQPTTNWFSLIRDTSLLALVLAAVFIVPVFALFSTIRWVARGFRNAPAPGVSARDHQESQTP